MPFNSQAIYQTTLMHYVKLGQQKGWKAYVWGQIQELDNDTSGLFKGIKEEFLAEMNRIKNENERQS